MVQIPDRRGDSDDQNSSSHNRVNVPQSVGDELKMTNEHLDEIRGNVGFPMTMIGGDAQASPPINQDTKARSLVSEQDDDDESELAEAARKMSRQWATDATQTLFWASSPTAPRLLPGLYKCIFTQETGPALKRLIVSTDDLIAMDDDAATTKVRGEIRKFWECEEKYSSMGLLHKRGIIMYGDPGSGKTATIQQLIAQLTAEGGVSIYADDPNTLTACLQLLRRIEPARRLIVILEDFETLTERSARENEWLSVLDGEAQISNVVFLATTNYIEKLDKRFTDRPSRFDTVVRVAMPSPKTRAVYLMSKLSFCDNELVKSLVVKTAAMSIAHLKEIVVAVFCLNDGQNMPTEERDVLIDRVVKKLREMQQRKFNSEQTKPESDEIGGKVGFGGNNKSKVEDGSGLDYDEVRRLANQYLVRLKKVGETGGSRKLDNTESSDPTIPLEGKSADDDASC